MYRVHTFDEAMDKAQKLLEDGGYGHTAAVYLSTRTATEKLDAFSKRMKAGRILINTPSAQGGSGDLYNFRQLGIRKCGCPTPDECENCGKTEGEYAVVPRT